MSDAEVFGPNDPSAPRALLLLGQNAEQARQFHNQPEHWALLAAHLRAAELSARVMTDDVSVLTPTELARYDVILNYSTGLSASDEQIEALLSAVQSGIGYVGLHAATVTFTQHPRYLAMIGARFQRHDPIKRFTVRFVDRAHPITHGLDDYEHEDELYELTADYENPKNLIPVTGIRVLAEAEGHPMVYVKEHGAGRVAYLASGHDARSLAQPTYRTLFTRAIAWAARKSGAGRG
ncbi:MAG TPA: ThuA domain-containing protein [Chloroflexota bacterium]|nr:ThuA domain-containing protein [Chloroflexota bacterium]